MKKPLLLTSVIVPIYLVSGLFVPSAHSQAGPDTALSSKYLSDLTPTTAKNGWGPVERDMSNGEINAGDGRALTLNGKSYLKGLGVHANSELRYNLGGACSTFSADIGVDDAVESRGSILFQVWADGIKMYDSGMMYGSSPTRAVSVSITGKNELALIVTDAGNGIGSDHGDWADAKVTCTSQAGIRYLSDMGAASAKNGWGPVERDLSNGESAAGDGGKLTLNGKIYAKGLGVHASSDVRYNLGGACTSFLAEIGVDDAVDSRGSIMFQVWADGIKMYDSGTMTGNSPTQTVNVNIAGRKELALIVTDAGNGIGSDHADWADAKVACNVVATPLSVIQMTPAPGEVASLSPAVTATFSSDVNPVTVSTSSLNLVKQGSTTPLAATVTYDASARKATLRPVSSLQNGTTYVATVKGGVSGPKTVAGDTLATDVKWNLATPATAPAVRYVSDMPWVSMKNGWGPIERDMSNGDMNSGDGRTLSLNGRTYPKGIGAHAYSDVRFNLGALCSTFSAEVGIADEAGDRASVVFQVWADGTKLYDSGVVIGTTPTQMINVSIAGRNELALIVTDGIDGNGADHANWADAKVNCSVVTDSTPPQVTAVAPLRSAVGVDVTKAKMTATFAEAVDHTTVTSATFLVRSQRTSALVPTLATYNAATRTATLDPVTSLESGSTYLITVKGGATGVKDLAGNALAVDENWSFTTGTGALRPQQPIVISGQQNVTLSGIYVRNLSGPCIIIRGNSKNIRVENSELGPCQGGVIVEASDSVTVANTYIYGDGKSGSGLDVTFSQNVAVTDNRIENVRTGVYSLSSSGVRVERNRFLNMAGPMPRGQFVQFNKVSGAGNRITCNVGQNVLGQSHPEDAINLFGSSGLASDPIQVIGNKIQGGGPSLSGGGIMMGDGGGSYQIARDNVLVDPGQYGVAVAGGTNMSVLNNRIYARQQPFTNVGLYVWNQDSAACSNVTAQGNEVNWTSSSGAKNPTWNAGNCGTVAGWTSNNWASSIDPTILNAPIAACAQ